MFHHLLIKDHPAFKSREFHLQPGITGVVGPNECGKSSFLESLAASLWGTQAWRSRATDYDKTLTDLTFSIRGVPYNVVRRGAKHELRMNGEIVATGNKAVNAHIRRLFGYGYGVYMTANHCAQGQLEALCNMKPTERRKMVDAVLGIDTLEQVALFANESALGFDRTVDTIEKSIQAPVEPVQPEGYHPSAELTEWIQQWRNLEQEATEINAFLRNAPVLAPAPIVPCEQTAADLQVLVDARNQIAAQVRMLERNTDKQLATPLPVDQLDAADAAWVAFHLWEERNRALAGVVEPGVSRESIAALQAQWDAYDLYQTWTKMKSGVTTCPECGHAWHNDQHWQTVNNAVPTEKPAETRAQLQAKLRKHDIWDGAAEARTRYATVQETARPRLAEEEIRRQRLLHQTYAERKQRQDELAAERLHLANTPDHSELLKRRLSYEAAVPIHQQAVATLQAWETQAAEKRARLAEIGDPTAQIALLEQHRNAALIYENAVSNHDSAKAAYETALAEREKAFGEAADWRRGRDALRDLRTRYKTYIVPSLTRAGSQLLSSMTGGQRQSLIVDEEFNVMVDEKWIEQLSGSTKGVANLSLRIGLGQVLTRNTFSVFVGDEIDNFMDQSRASLTNETLRGLVHIFDQVILVSHKPLVADHIIDLGAEDLSDIAA